MVDSETRFLRLVPGADDAAALAAVDAFAEAVGVGGMHQDFVRLLRKQALIHAAQLRVRIGRAARKTPPHTPAFPPRRAARAPKKRDGSDDSRPRGSLPYFPRRLRDRSDGR